MNRKRLFLSSFFLGAVLIAPMAITANAAPQRNEQVNAQTYTGKINKKEDQYILENKDKKSSYKLDDATKAEKFNGDNVAFDNLIWPTFDTFIWPTLES